MNSKSIESFVWYHHILRNCKNNLSYPLPENFTSAHISSSDCSLLNLILPFKVILRRIEVVFWCLKWECCTFQKIDENSFKLTNTLYMALNKILCYTQCKKYNSSLVSDTGKYFDLHHTSGGGGGGGHFHIYAYWVCAAQETPIFSPKFPLQTTNEKKKSTPEHHHFTFFAAPEFETQNKLLLKSTLSTWWVRIINHYYYYYYSRNFFTIKKFQAIHRRPRPAYCSQPKRKAFVQRYGVSGRPDASYSQFWRPHFHARARYWAPHFHARTRSGSPILHFAAAHTYQNLGRVTPPHPPPPPITLLSERVYEQSLFGSDSKHTLSAIATTCIVVFSSVD